VNTTRQRPDDQYVMPVEASRRGAHRARVSPFLAALPFVAVAIVVTGVVALAWTLFGGTDTGSTAQPAGVVTAASSPASTRASGSTTKSPAATKSSATTKAGVSTPPAATVDKGEPVVVRNSTRTKGLAARAASALKDQGWTIRGTPDNYRPAIDSTVFYAQDAQKATAEAVAKDLGIARVTKDADLAARGVTVILGGDYTP
jgi:hypothetical protein